MKNRFLIPLAVLLLLGAGCAGQVPEDTELNDQVTLTIEKEEIPVKENNQVQIVAPTVLPDEQIKNKQIRLNTAKGDIVFELYADTAPLTVSNFVGLTEAGYFDGLTFHRREEGFVIQGGDPSGNGTGGPGYTFPDELDDEYGYERGVVAMANRGPDTNGSQFFIMLGNVQLPKAYTIFGRVTEGLEVVDAIKIGDEMATVVVEELAE